MFFLTKGATGGHEAKGYLRAVCESRWKPEGPRLLCMRLGSRQRGRDTDLFTVSPTRPYVVCECMDTISF